MGTSWALLVTVVLVLTSCSSGSDDQPAEERTPSVVPAVRGIDPVTQETLVDLLARGGIQTYAAAGDDQPIAAADEPGPLTLTAWQVETMQRQVNAGRGYAGRDLDELTGSVSGGVPISVVLAAWISAADTEASAVARELMGERDYEHFALSIVYPDAVVSLFVNDIARDLAAGATDASGSSASPAFFRAAPAARAGICSDLVGQLSGALDSVVESLQIQVAEAGVTSVLASIWNTVVSIAATAAQIAVQAFTSALLAPVTRAITLVAVLTEAATLFDPWVPVTTVAPADSLPPGVDATVTTDVQAAVEFEWPADLKDCASTLTGVTLPDPGSAAGSPVTWTYDDPYATTNPGARDSVLDTAGTARLAFATKDQDPSELDGSPVAYPVLVGTDVERTQVKKLTDLIADLMLGGLPAPARAIVDALLGPVKSATQAKLAELASVKGKKLDIQTIRYQKSPEPVPPPVTEEDDCASVALGTVPDGKWTGPIDLAVTGKGLTGQAFSGGKGTMTMVVKNGKVTSGTWGVGWRSTGLSSEGGMNTKIKIRGVINGGVKGSAGQPQLRGQWRIVGTATVDIVGAIPLDFSGKDTETLKIESTTCDAVSGTFIPSFNAKGAPATFSGTARWTGSKVG